MKRLLKTLLVLSIVFFGLAYVVTDHMLPYILLNPQKIHLDTTPTSLNLKGMGKEVYSKDGFLLKGYRIDPIQSE